MLEAPRYRTTRFTAYGGIPYKEGSVVGGVVGHTLWPDPWLEPLNEGARRIADYFAKNHANRLLPARPFDHDVAHAFHLPGFLRDAHRGWLPEYREVAGAPRYTTSGAVAFSDRSVDGRKGFPWLGWPLERSRMANEAAERVLQYLADNEEHPLLPKVLAPWDDYSRGLWLPRLAAVRERRPVQYVTDHGMVDEHGALV